MLRERLIGSFRRGEKDQKIIFNFSPFQNCNKIIQAVVNQILLKEVGNKCQNQPFGHKVIFKKWLEHSLWWETRQLLRESECCEDCQLLPLIFLEKLQGLEESSHDIFKVLDEKRPSPQNLLYVDHRWQNDFTCCLILYYGVRMAFALIGLGSSRLCAAPSENNLH